MKEYDQREEKIRTMRAEVLAEQHCTSITLISQVQEEHEKFMKSLDDSKRFIESLNKQAE